MGRTAVEYATDQITVYPSCPFGCHYCWASTPLMQHRIRNPKPLQEARFYARSRKKRIIVVSFTTDPYQIREFRDERTKRVLEILIPTQHRVMILTKSGGASWDFDLIRGHSNVWLGMTVTSLKAIPDEPRATPNPRRISLLEEAHNLGIPTWLSLEPWIPGYTNGLDIVQTTHPFVDWYVIGRLDYEKQFGYDPVPDNYYLERLPPLIEYMEEKGIRYHIKSQLWKTVKRARSRI